MTKEASLSSTHLPLQRVYSNMIHSQQQGA